jgi:hypothetical protein
MLDEVATLPTWDAAPFSLSFGIEPTLATRALDEFDLSPDDRQAAVRLLLQELTVRTSRTIEPDQVRAVLRELDCEDVARRRSAAHSPTELLQ